MRRMPDDILRSIFVASLPRNRGAAISSDESPLLLCQICRLWRDIALKTPPLWASIYVIIPPEHLVPQLSAVLSTWIARAGSIPLSFDLANSAFSSSYDRTEPIVRLVTSISHRWRSLRTIALGNLADIPAFYSLTSSDVPNLARVAIQLNWGYESTAESRRGSLILLESPSLRSLELTGRYERLPLSLPWGNLCSLKLQWPYGDNPEFPFHILQRCQRLQTFEFVAPSTFILAPTEPFILPNLEELCITGTMATTIEHNPLFATLLAPQLNTISATLDAYFPQITWLRPITSQITLLNLRQSTSSNLLLAALREMFALEDLTLHLEPQAVEIDSEDLNPRISLFAPADPSFLLWLTPGVTGTGAATSECILPRLRRIRLIGFSALTERTIVTFVASRWRAGRDSDSGVALLSRASFTLHRQRELDVKQELREMGVDLGLLNLSLVYIWNDDPVQKYSAKPEQSTPNLYDLNY
ncbi:hypothetical protein C8F01DRAFT_1156961 [Mycena amicta]|nr:hypothetical protein C8F01DRAFT_1156961 [Mycena amicta]